MTGDGQNPKDPSTGSHRRRSTSVEELWLDDPLDADLVQESVQPYSAEDSVENSANAEEPEKHRRIRIPRISSKLWTFFASHKSMLLRGLVGLAFVAVTVGGALGLRHYLLSSPAFNVRTIEVSSMRHDLSMEIKKATDPYVGRNIFTVSMDDVAGSVKKIPWVADARAWRSLPDTIHVDVVEHEVAAALFIEKHGFFLVSRRGRVFKKASPSELRGLTVITGLSVSQLDHSDLPLREVLDFMETYRQNPARPPMSEVRHMGMEIAFILRSVPVEVRISTGSDLKQRLETFDRIYRTIRDDLQKKTIIYIDIADKPGTAVVSHPDEVNQDQR